MPIDIFVRDKRDGKIHRVGDCKHDSLWVSTDGVVHYHNLQNGEGAPSNSADGYEFVSSDIFGVMV